MSKYKRIIIKISGETLLSDDRQENLDFHKIKPLAEAIKKIVKAGYQVGLVFGAGNIWRGRLVKNTKFDRVMADQMGMLATEINALAVAGVLESLGQKAKVMSAMTINKVVDDFHHQKAVDYMKNKNVVLFAGGTGNPFFTTDTAFVLRAIEVGADYIFKATNVRGVFDSDPIKNPKAKFFTSITYQEALAKNLKVMDATAFALAQEYNLPLTVFKYSPANLVQAVSKNNIGSKVR